MMVFVKINYNYTGNNEDGSRDYCVLLCWDFSSINDIAEKR